MISGLMAHSSSGVALFQASAEKKGLIIPSPSFLSLDWSEQGAGMQAPESQGFWILQKRLHVCLFLLLSPPGRASPESDRTPASLPSAQHLIPGLSPLGSSFVFHLLFGGPVHICCPPYVALQSKGRSPCSGLWPASAVGTVSLPRSYFIIVF